MTGLRAVAAIAVFASHLDLLMPPVGGRSSGPSPALQVLDWGAHGVGLFFVLSGFVLAWSWDQETTPTSFFMARLARVWPAHGATWVAFVLASRIGLVGRWSIAGEVASLLLVQAWVPGAGLANAVNPVAWTLSCEAFFYLTFPVLMAVVQRLDRRQLVTTAVVLTLAGVAVMALVLEPRGIVVSTFPPFRWLEFAIGAIAGTLVRRGACARTWPVGVACSTLVGLLAAARWWAPARGMALGLLVVPFVWIVAGLAVRDLAARSTWVSGRVWRRAGELSYCFYLVQLLPFALVLRAVGPRVGAEAVESSVVTLLLTAVAAAALHYGVEKPAMAAVRSRIGR